MLKGSKKSDQSNDVGKSSDNPWTVATKVVKGIVNSKTGRRKYAESGESSVPTKQYVSNFG